MVTRASADECQIDAEVSRRQTLCADGPRTCPANKARIISVGHEGGSPPQILWHLGEHVSVEEIDAGHEDLRDAASYGIVDLGAGQPAGSDVGYGEQPVL